MSALAIGGLVFAGIAAYSTIAGMVFRRLRGRGPCGGKNMALGYFMLGCEYPSHRMIRRTAWCRDCIDHDDAERAAILWPLAGILSIPVMCFRAGANLRQIPKTGDREREPVS